MKKILLVVLSLAVLAGLAEGASAYLLFRYYARTANDFYPRGSATVFLARKIVVNKIMGHYDTATVTADQGPVYVPDERLGYTTVPGRYRVLASLDGREHAFHLQVVSPGRRAAAPRPVQAPRRLYVMGNSSLYGWGIDDEQTLAWLLQTRLPDYEVVNLSMTGYSSVHALLQLETLAPGDEDIVVIGYEQYSRVLDTAAPEWIEHFSTGLEVQLGRSPEIQLVDYPYGALDAGGALEIRRGKMSCKPELVGDHCAQAPDPERREQVTRRVFERIASRLGARLVVGWIEGPDQDPVLDALRGQGVRVADLRGEPGTPEAVDLVPDDDHPGPYRHRLMAEQLLRFIGRPVDAS